MVITINLVTGIRLHFLRSKLRYEVSAFLPVLALMLALKMSPLERCFSPKLLVMRADTVPFPEPGGPIMTARKILCRDISG